MGAIGSAIAEKLSWIWRTLTSFRLGYVIEILIIAVLVYFMLKWIKQSRAWMLLRGLLVVLFFAILAYVFRLSVILWIFTNLFSVIVVAIIIIFQPEIRRALEQLGRRGIVSNIFNTKGVSVESLRQIEKCMEEIRHATIELSREKTGALIVIEKEVMLKEYERTGIVIDSKVSSQLLVNIFQKNTPLHDGAVIVRGNRIVAATCYLPLTDNSDLSKRLGTRHRAAVGISEVSDSLTVVVSEETGEISLAIEGDLMSNVTPEQMKNELIKFIGLDKLEDSRKETEKTDKAAGKALEKAEKAADTVIDDAEETDFGTTVETISEKSGE
ncbi:MAG: diadenylate cyclase CdaA [Lachnospiraceae bacterium]|nr:diadenylate cyclase CdaA [Lachnospiraceae bacterium]